MKSILVPTDFSPIAQAALDVAVTIAKKVDSQVSLLHVIESPYESSFNVEGQTGTEGWENKLFELKLIETSRNKLYRLVDQLKEKGITVRPILRLGDPYHGIQTVIDEQGADLIIMGTNGRPGFRDRPVGTNTEKVVRRAKCPVLAIPSQQKKNDFKSIVYATMMRDEETTAIDLLKNTQSIFKSWVHVVRVNTPGLFEADHKAVKRMTEFVQKMKLKDCSISTFNDVNEEEGIVRFAESVDADLIVMGTHARTALAHILSGSITEEVVNRSRIPVLTCHLSAKKKSKAKALPAGFNM